MTFPQTPIDVRYELNVAGAWTDISDKVYDRDTVQITRGRDDEEAQAQPVSAKLTIDNRGGQFSPRNPRSPYFEVLGRNTPIRISLPYGSSYLGLPGGDNDYISAPDTAALSITGDIDVRVEASLGGWRTYNELAGKYLVTGNQRSWALVLNKNGTLSFFWSPDGTLTSRIQVDSTVPVPATGEGRMAARVTLDVNNGASGNTVTFYTADSISSSWTQLGAAVINSGTTSIFDSTAPLTVGFAGGAPPWTSRYNAAGKVHAFEVRSGIGGSIVAGLDFTAGLFGVPYTVGSKAQAAGVGATVVTNVTTPVAAGQKIFVVVSSSGGATVNSLTDTAGNTYSLVVSAVGTTPRTHLYAADAVTELTASDTVTVDTSAAGNAYNVIVGACSGVGAADKTNTASGTSTAPSVTSAALSSAYQLVLGAISNGNGGGAPTWPAQWALFTPALHDGFTQWTTAARRVVGSAAAVTASATITSASWTALVATFTPAENLGTGPWKDGYDNLWSVNAGADPNVRVDDRDYRFYGEINSWPPRWDVSEEDRWVPIEARGITQRLGQGKKAVRSVMYRYIKSAGSSLVAYFPCEDGVRANQLASAVGGPPAKFWKPGRPTLAAFDGFICSDKLPTLQLSTWICPVPYYTTTGSEQMSFLLAIPENDTDPVLDGAYVGTIKTIDAGNGPIYWSVRYFAGGKLKFLVEQIETGTVLLDDGVRDFALNGALAWVSMRLVTNGSGVDWRVDVVKVGDTSASNRSGTLASTAKGRADMLIVAGGDVLHDTAFGHLALETVIRPIGNHIDVLNARAGETAGRRFERICAEEGIAFRGVGDLDATAAMGPQKVDQLLNIARDCADADLGVMFEPRDLLGLAIRTRESLYNQPARVPLDYAAGHVAPDLEPVDDDQAIRNDVTVQRQDGSEYGIEQATGPLNTQDPADDPDGVGRYDTSVTINVDDDPDLPNQAGWRLHLGTTDEARYPRVAMDLAAPGVAGDQALTMAIRAADVGDRLTIDNPPAWLPPDQISQLVQGYTETFGQYDHDIIANCTPESPWRVALRGTGRRGSAGSELAAGIGSADTSLSVATTSGPLWTTAAGEMPFDILIGGERMTVTAITGSSSPQTFTVTRSVNGIVKSHSATGTAKECAVRLFQPAVRAL